MEYGNHGLYRSQSQNLGPIKDKNKRPKRYMTLLILFKCLHSLGTFLCYEVLQSASFVQFIFFIKLCAAVFFMAIHKPISHGKKLSRKDWKHIVTYSCCSLVLTFLWMEALIICGPVRTLLLWQHSDTAIIAMMNLFFNTEGNTLPTASRGGFFYAFGLFSLFFFDRDYHGDHAHHELSAIPTHVYHHFIDVFNWLGLPDHKGGILLLLCLSIAKVFFNTYGNKISLDIGGPKRLKSLSVFMESLFLIPIWLFSFIQMDSATQSVFSFIPEILFVLFIIFIGDFYVESISITHLHKYLSYRLGTIVSFSSAVVIGIIWEYWKDMTVKHKISTGVPFTAIFFIAATRLLVQPPPIRPRGNLIGYSTSGEPLYSYATSDGYVPKSVFVKLRQYLRIIIESPDSRNIFMYLCLNLMFTGVELLYGMWTNSLGLISDGFHMLFDCSALVLGLWASIASKWSATKTFSFGYARLEVLSGFVNGLFLVVIAFAVFMTAMQRIYDPPTVSTEKLLFVSVAGLLVNLVGITAFSHAHSHGGKACDHGHSHEKHSHSQSDHSHSHNNQSHGHTHSHGHGDSKHKKEKNSANMQGVFLHVLADTMGSVGVIVSTLLIQYYDLYIADPICSLFISALIFLSVIPLLKDSSLVLLQRTSKELEEPISEALLKIRHLDGVLSYRDVHFWQHTSETNAGSIIVQVSPTVSEHKIRQQVMSILKECDINLLTVQVEKEAFHEHMSKLTTGYYSLVSFPETSSLYLRTTNDVSVRVKDI